MYLGGRKSRPPSQIAVPADIDSRAAPSSLSLCRTIRIYRLHERLRDGPARFARVYGHNPHKSMLDTRP